MRRKSHPSLSGPKATISMRIGVDHKADAENEPPRQLKSSVPSRNSAASVDRTAPSTRAVPDAEQTAGIGGSDRKGRISGIQSMDHADPTVPSFAYLSKQRAAHS